MSDWYNSFNGPPQPQRPEYTTFKKVLAAAALGVIVIGGYRSMHDPAETVASLSVSDMPASHTPKPSSTPTVKPTSPTNPPHTPKTDTSCQKKSLPDDRNGRYFKKYCAAAITAEKQSGVPRALTLAMSAHESGYGQSGLTKNAHNFFGIKDNSAWNGPVYKSLTHETLSGDQIAKLSDVKSKTKVGADLYDVTIIARFREYDSAAASFADYGNYLKTRTIGGQRIYADAFSQTDAKKFLHRLVDNNGPKYATDPVYEQSADRLINQFEDLYDK